MKIRHIAMAVAVALGSSYAMADTSSAIRGRISNPEGAAAAGTKIIILHVPSGTSRTVVTNDSGSFVASGLRVGGPYKIIVDSDTYNDETVNDVFLNLGDTLQFNRQLKMVEEVERIAVTGTVIADQTTGTSSTYGQTMIEESPSFNRDIKDLVRNNPLAVVSDDNQLSFAGANSKFNNFSVDGIGQNDDFGLNTSGYPASRSPISLDAISQISVDVTPFTARAGGFSGGAINAVTKSGTNDLSGSFFYELTNDSLAGDAKSRYLPATRKFSISEESSMGATLGGAIVEDKLFYFVSAETWDKETPVDFGVGSGTNISNITQAQLDAVFKTLKDVYGITDGLAGNPEESDDKLLVKLDWNINDLHRADFTYQYQKNVVGASYTNSANNLNLLSRVYDNETVTSNFAGHLFSDWTDEFSTEFSFAYKDVQVNPILNAYTAAYSIQVSSSGFINGGTDVFRHANVAENRNLKLSWHGTYLFEEHTMKFGYEVERLNLFNLFAESSLGSWSFSSAADFAAKRPIQPSSTRTGGFDYKNAPSNNINDTAFDMTRLTHALYIEDEFAPFDDVEVTAGLRYERLGSDDLPAKNPSFEKTYGFSNTENMDGLDVLLPRIGFRWYVDDSVTLRGGMGIYTGGQPNVWVTNSYTNNGMTFVQTPLSVRNSIVTNPSLVDFNKVPDAAKNSLKAGGFTNYIDPNFKLPTDNRFQLAIDYNFDLPVIGDDITATLDTTYIQSKNTASWLDTSRQFSSNASDGRIIYKSRYSNDLRDNYDIIMTNLDETLSSRIISASLAKSWESGVRLTTSYTNQDTEEANSGTSSRAVSNFGNNVVINRNEPLVGASTNQIEHRFVVNLGYNVDFFDGYETKFNLFFERKSGRPFSFVLDSNRDGGYGDQTDLNNNDVYLPYIPASATDPRMKFGNGTTTGLTYDQIMAVVRAAGLESYAGGYAPKNAFNQPWVTTADLNIIQEIPGLVPEHEGEVYFTILNLANLLNKDSGQIHRLAFSQQNLFGFDVDANGLVSYQSVNNNDMFQGAKNWSGFYPSQSVWRIKAGVKYRF